MAILEGKDCQAWPEQKDRIAVKEAGRRNQNQEWRADLPKVMPEKPGLVPRMVRFEPVLVILRLRVRLRADELQKGETVHLQRSFPHLAGG